MYQKIILAYDGSLESQQALLNCKDLSQWEHAKVHLLSVVPYETISMGHETSYYSEPEIKLEEERRMKTLNEVLNNSIQLGLRLLENYSKVTQ